MAFPTNWTLQHKIESDYTKVSGTANLTDFPALLTEDNFLSSIFSASQGKQLSSNYLNSDANLQGYWKLESDWTDESSNGYDLTASGSPTFTTGKFGNGADLEAGSSQYASIADGSCPNLEITGSQTFSCWFKPESITSFQVLMAKSTAATAHHDMYFDSNGTVVFRINGLTTNTAVSSTPKIAAGNWYHIAGVYDSGAQKLKVFINGVKTEVTASGTGTDTNGAFYIGRNGDGNYLDGIIDDVAVFNRALSDAEVKAIYTGGADLRFTTDEAGTNQIPHEVVNWDIDNSEAEVWVKIPTLSYNTATTIYVWSGNSSALPYGRELATFNSLYNDANLQGYWKLESDGTDETANSYDLTVNGSPTFNTGMFGNSVSLSSGTTQYLNISNASSVNLPKGNVDYTYSFWIKPNATPNSQYGILGYSNSGVNFNCFHWSGTTQKVTFVVDNDLGASVTSTTALKSGTWYQIAVVHSSTNDTVKIYVNGVLENTDTYSGTPGTATGDFYIGKIPGVSGNVTVANFDDVAIFNRALSDAEVKAIYTGGADLRFTTDEAGTNQIPHEVVNWDIDNSEAEVWVKIPTLSYNTATTIYVWANNSSATPVGRELATFNSLYNDANLQGYWKLEDATDETANSYNLTGTAPTYTTGKFGNGGDFEASSSQYLAIADASCPNLEISGSQTWSAWIKKESDAPAAGYRIMCKGKLSNASARKDIFVNVNQNVVAGFYDGSTRDVTSNAKIANGVWYHVAAVYNATDQKIYLYINGALDNTGTAGSSTTDSNAPFAIGCAYFGASDTASAFFDGIIDDVAIFNRALSADEIAGLYGSGAGVWGDFEYVSHDGGLTDSTSNNRTGTNNGATVDTSSKIGSGTVFDGSSHIDVASGFAAGANDLYLAAWIKYTGNTTGQFVFSTRNTDGFDLLLNNASVSGNGVFRFYSNATNSSGDIISGLGDNSWHFFAATVDRTAGEITTYVDNDTPLTETYSSGNLSSDNNLDIGQRPSGTALPYTGSLDELRIAFNSFSDGWLATEYNNQNSPSTFWIELTNYTDELTDTITLADSISRGVTYNRGTVSAITLADNVDRYSIYTRNISTEGSNIILNPSFEDGDIDNWTLNGGGVTVVQKSSTYANSGTYSLRVLSISPISSANGESDYTNVSSSTTYNLSFYCRKDISDSNATYRVIGYDSGDNPTDLISTTAINTTAGSFVQVTDTFTTASDTVKIKVFLAVTTSTGDIYYDDVSVFQEGSDTISVTDNIDYEYTAGTIIRSLLSSLTITDNLDRQINYIREQLSGLTATDTINRQQNSIRGLINTLTLADNIDNSVLSLFLVNLSSSLSIGDNIDKTTSYSKQLLEAINVAENLVRNVDYSRVLSGSITITDSLDFVNLLSRELTSALSLGDNLDRVLNINVTLSDGISLDDALDIQNTLNRSIESSLILGDNIDATIVLSRSLTSGITVADNLDFTFVINRDLSDTITLTDTIDRVARYIGKSIASIGEIDTIKPTIQGVEKTKGTTYKIDKDRPILYSIRKG